MFLLAATLVTVCTVTVYTEPYGMKHTLLEQAYMNYTQTSDIVSHHTIGGVDSGSVKTLSEAVYNVDTKPKNHIVFVKVHKAASTTVHNVFMRFALGNDLEVMHRHDLFHINEWNDKIPINLLINSSKNELIYDMVCGHLIYNRKEVSKFVPNDTMYVGIIRDPFQQFMSGFVFYSPFMQEIKNVIAKDHLNPIEEFFRDPKKYLAGYPPNVTFLNNRMSVDFGFPNDNLETEKKRHICLHIYE